MGCTLDPDVFSEGLEVMHVGGDVEFCLEDGFVDVVAAVVGVDGEGGLWAHSKCANLEAGLERSPTAGVAWWRSAG